MPTYSSSRAPSLPAYAPSASPSSSGAPKAGGTYESIEPTLISPPRPRRISSSTANRQRVLSTNDENHPPTSTTNIGSGTGQWQNYQPSTVNYGYSADQAELDYHSYFFNDGYGGGGIVPSIPGHPSTAAGGGGGGDGTYGGGLLGLQFLPTTCINPSFPSFGGIATIVPRWICSTGQLGREPDDRLDDYAYMYARREHEISIRARNGERFPTFCPIPFVEKKRNQAPVTVGRDSPQAADIHQNGSLLNVFSALPGDAVTVTLSMLCAGDIGTLAIVSKALTHLCVISPAWKNLCLRTGKLLPSEDVQSPTDAEQSSHFAQQITARPTVFSRLYRSAICVPVDVPTITMAVRTAILKGIKVITLMPGVYQERIEIGSDVIDDVTATLLADDGHDNGRLIEIYGNGIELEIRAANPTMLTTVIHVCGTENTANLDQICPTVAVFTDDVASPELGGAGIGLTLANLSIVHSVPGTDIWNRNTAIKATGNVGLCVRNCFVTSRSGRGIVVSGQAAADLVESSLFACAGTGLYVGDEGTDVVVSKCNIVNNGYGGRPMKTPSIASLPSVETNSDMLAIIQDSLSIDTAPALVGRMVPSGHSGVYVEAASAVFDDTLIASSCLTGMTVVRSAEVRLSGCDVMENGDAPISDEDFFLRERAERGEGENNMRGKSVELGPTENHLVIHAPSVDWPRTCLRVPRGIALD
eukprot:CAMPEP_0178582064 /NCGR_PEP_ID=MMETSP0697-20121206/23525_1 /TAXON_ID=265572 /ORGANISM="Extubocellulus spinifer, Strain CCMP396" /LENGTH=700 /DNA_ID=CAMNT_0020217771 /DNA_START=2023 /DNA_END=4125 /DNA_ORIENTATION=-